MATWDVCRSSCIRLNEALLVLKDTASRQVFAVGHALEIWLGAVEQLPQHPSNSQTAAAVEAVQAALQQSPVRMPRGVEESLAWLRQYMPTASTAITAQLNKQADITLQRLDVLKQLGSSQSASCLAAEQQVCALMLCALQTYRVIGPMAVLLKTWDELLALRRRLHKSVRVKKSLELHGVQAALAHMSEGLQACVVLFNQSDAVREQLHAVYPSEPKLYVFTELNCKADYVATLAADDWLTAALQLPANATHHVSEIIFSALDWTAVMNVAPHDSDLQEHLAEMVGAAMGRQDLRDCFINSLQPELTGLLLHVLGITDWHLKQGNVPEATQQQLLAWQTQAASTSKSTAGVCMASISEPQESVHPQGEAGCSSSGKMKQAAAVSGDSDTGDGFGMQELLNMIHGMPDVGKPADGASH